MSARTRIREFCRKARTEYPNEPMPILAGKLAAELREKAPTLLQEWLEESLEEFLYEVITLLGREDRSSARQAAKGHRLERFVDELLDADDIVDANGTRKPHRDMKKAETLFVAARKGEIEREARFDRIFWEVVADRQGRKTVGQAFPGASLADPSLATPGDPTPRLSGGLSVR